MTLTEIQRVDISTLNARANELIDLIGQGKATEAEQQEFSLIHAEFDRRFDMVHQLNQTLYKEGM